MITLDHVYNSSADKDIFKEIDFELYVNNVLNYDV